MPTNISPFCFDQLVNREYSCDRFAIHHHMRTLIQFCAISLFWSRIWKRCFTDTRVPPNKTCRSFVRIISIRISVCCDFSVETDRYRPTFLIVIIILKNYFTIFYSKLWMEWTLNAVDRVLLIFLHSDGINCSRFVYIFILCLFICLILLTFHCKTYFVNDRCYLKIETNVCEKQLKGYKCVKFYICYLYASWKKRTGPVNDATTCFRNEKILDERRDVNHFCGDHLSLAVFFKIN